MKTYTKDELTTILTEHKNWLDGKDGKRANLSYANLYSADLRNADLSYANLSYANLGYADLRNANLYSANLYSANLSYANLSYANLSLIKEDFFRVLDVSKNEVLGLYQALFEGKIDGTQYEGECACLVGTIANLRCESPHHLKIDLRPNLHRPLERWFLAIKKGDTPINNPVSKIVSEWIKEFAQKEGIKLPTMKVIWE